jgi:hypothetical protein
MSEQACHIVCPHCTSINAATSVASRGVSLISCAPRD